MALQGGVREPELLYDQPQRALEVEVQLTAAAIARGGDSPATTPTAAPGIYETLPLPTAPVPPMPMRGQGPSGVN